MTKNTYIPRDSILPVDSTRNDQIGHRITPDSGEFHIQTHRIRSGFHRIPDNRIPGRITPEKILSVPTETDHRILP